MATTEPAVLMAEQPQQQQQQVEKEHGKLLHDYYSRRTGSYERWRA